MKSYLAGSAALVAMLVGAAAVQARPQIYSFETGTPAAPDDFFGLGASVARSTIGATSGPSSLRYAAGNDGFVGART
ncbi:MAG: hypothetical protein H7Z14_20065, partial [Anaerolineae bacterium]|nr:hypothetical protein [Phycisphaerae bacterium]